MNWLERNLILTHIKDPVLKTYSFMVPTHTKTSVEEHLALHLIHSA